jgi:uncharacterized protein (DUF433 family)
MRSATGLLEERVESGQLRRRPAVLGYELVDLVAELSRVGACRPYVPLGDERMVSRQRRFVACVGVEHLDDLPDVEATSDHPGPAGTPTESHARVQPGLGGLLGQLLDDDAARPTRPPDFIFDEQVRLLTEADRERLGLGGHSYSVVDVAILACERANMANDHPMITLADGPAGRRPRLVGTGLDVWEAIWVVRDNDGDEREAAGYLKVPVELVTAAVAYYEAHTAEIDEWIELNARESDAAYAAWLAKGAADG